MATTRKTYSPEERKARILKYCAYRERCHQEVRQKLYELGAGTEEVNLLMVDLIEWNYLNEERYARAFCRGKFLHNKWGKIKILQSLKQKGISEFCVKSGMKEIDQESYDQLLHELVEKALSASPSRNLYKQRAEAARKVIQKGFEPELVWDKVKQLKHE